VESFNRILISALRFDPPFERGIQVFSEKSDLLPFEEAKLFGHNATHALAAYLGEIFNIQRIADAPTVPGLMEFLRRAFIEESGAALIHRYHGIDPMFTSQGYTDYADDLLRRMVNPWLADTVDRVGRDIERKLCWDDRLVGTLRLGIAEGILAHRYALGAAAALTRLDPALLSASADPAGRLLRLWGDSPRDTAPPFPALGTAAQERAVLTLIRGGLDRLRGWYSTPDHSPLSLLDIH
jgi:mannitol-1-phosphate/altronate dehydrogenase